jgi:anti-sigma regulatory factor (Ser/Thr protein kinase)
LRAAGDRLSPQPRSGADGGTVSADGRLVVLNNFSELERVGEWMNRFARERGLAREHAYGLDLAVAEALTNIMSYAYRDDAQHDIIVELRTQPDQIRVQIEDDGVPFDPLNLPVQEQPRSLEEAQPTGRGIPLMRSFMSELHYLRRDDRNVLTMVLNCAAN